MMTASMDIREGAVVQWVEGQTEALRTRDFETWIRRLGPLGTVAVVDLDAALGGKPQKALAQALCRRMEVRLAGGIRTREDALDRLAWGAVEVVVGSRVFAEGQVDEAFLEDLAEAVGRHRLFVAVDARDGRIATRRSRQTQPLDVLEAARRIAPRVGGLLFTSVEREGHLGGTDLERARILAGICREASCRLTVAGGIRNARDIAELQALGADAQVGMALYTGALEPWEGFAAGLKWSSEGLLPVLACDPDGQPLMLAWQTREALRLTLERGEMVYYSRSRQQLWHKGEGSGNRQRLLRLQPDCDGDCLLARVEPLGPACHTGRFSCFGEPLPGLEQLAGVLACRRQNPASGSYSSSLSPELIREKIREEAQELCEARTREELVWEGADLLFFLTALLEREGVSPTRLFAELRRRRLAGRRVRLPENAVLADPLAGEVAP